MAANLYFYVPLGLTLLWLVLSLSVNFRMTQLENTYTEHLAAMPKVMTHTMLSIVQSYKKTWFLNGIAWGIVPFLVAIWLPRLSQIYCAMLLLVLCMLTLTRTHSDRRLMNAISNILVGSQVLALVFLLVWNSHQKEDYIFLAISIVSLFFFLGLLRFTSNLLNMLVRQYLNTVYSNISTIQKLKKMQNQRNDALQLLWHDLRAPQAAILTLIRTRSDDEMVSPTSRNSLNQKIAKQVQTTLELADNFVWQLRAESDTYDFQEVDVVQLVHEVVEKAWPFAQEKNMNLSSDMSQLIENKLKVQGIYEPTELETENDDQKTQNFWLMLEPRLMGRAIFNLIENAIKYSPAGTSVVVEIRVREAAESTSKQSGNNQQEPMVEIIVKDEGYGILEKNIPRIFDPYTRFSSPANPTNLAHTPAASGHGLGLRLVKTVVEMHKGLVRCQSVPNVGSTFTIELPLQV